MKNISIDIETFSDVDLQKCGVYKYAPLGITCSFQKAAIFGSYRHKLHCIFVKYHLTILFHNIKIESQR